jgi:hypothetical protein
MLYIIQVCGGVILKLPELDKEIEVDPSIFPGKGNMNGFLVFPS